MGICGALTVGVAVLANGVLPGTVATRAGALVEQVGRGMPGSAVTCQQDTKLLRKIHIPAAKIAATPNKINWKMEGRVNAPGFRTGSDLFSVILLSTHFRFGSLGCRLRLTRLPKNVPIKMMATIIIPQAIIPSVTWAWSSDMGNGSPKTLEAALTVPTGKNSPMITIAATMMANNLPRKAKNWAGFIAMEASITPAKTVQDIQNVPTLQGSRHIFANFHTRHHERYSPEG
jgi:hypothetical protein